MTRLRLDDTRLDELPVPASGQIDYWDPALPGFGLRVSQGGRRAWVVMVREAGRKRRITLGAYPALSLAEARAKRRTLFAPAPMSRDSRVRATFGRGIGPGQDASGLVSRPAEGGPSLNWFLERTPVPFLVVEGGLIRRANAAAAALLDAEAPAALIGRALLDFVHPLDRAAFTRRQATPAAPVSAKESPFRLRLVRFDGLAMPLALTIAPLSDQPFGALGIFMTDPTGRGRMATGIPRGMAEPVPSASPTESQFVSAVHATSRRSLAKTATWYVTGSLDTFAVASIITGRLEFGVFIAVAEVLTKLLLYYLHERVWAHVQWGLQPK